MARKNSKQKNRSTAPAKRTSSKNKAKSTSSKARRSNRQTSNSMPRILCGGLETGALLVSGLAVMLLTFGLLPRQFTGTDPVSHLLPFLASAVAICIISAIFLIAWWKVRRRLNSASGVMPALLAIAFMAIILLGVPTERYVAAYRNLKIMIGGKREADRVTLAHQVYAAYRRQSPGQLAKLAKRSEKYRDNIYAAATAFDLDPDLLFGIAATESSFYPRKSNDGGTGLFQLTAVPRKVNSSVDKLESKKAGSDNGSHRGALLAAATLNYYIEQMNGDLFLGLLAYNIGPANGGLRFIMDQYNVADFISIQPYLQSAPRNYPIRVLAYALAFRLYHRKIGILPYEEGTNALKIQQIGIPSLGGL